MKHYLGISLVLLTLAAILLFVLRRCEDAVARTAAGVSRTFLTALQVQPEIRVNQVIIHSQTAPIAELAIVSKEQLVTYSLNEKIRFLQLDVPLTGKTITAQAIYRIKAGYDLKEPFRVEIDPTSHRVTAQLPPAKILSIERIGDLTLQDQDNLLNRITPEERQKVLNDLDKLARQGAEQSSLVQDAEAQTLTRLKELAERNGQTIHFAPDKRNFLHNEK